MSSPFFIQSKLGDLVIDIEGASTKPGTPLDVFTKKTKSPDWNNQLWEFVPSYIEEFYVIQNPASGLVIDVEGANTKPGTLIDAFTKKTKSPDWDNQLWTFVDEQRKSVTPPVYTTPPVQPPPK